MSRLRSLVLCERTVRISSSTGRPCGGRAGTPYTSRSRSRIRATRRAGGRRHPLNPALPSAGTTPPRPPPPGADHRPAQLQRLPPGFHGQSRLGLADQRVGAEEERLRILDGLPQRAFDRGGRGRYPIAVDLVGRLALAVDRDKRYGGGAVLDQLE